MKILLGMNLSPSLGPLLQNAGYEAKHWLDIGSPTDSDQVILSWAQENGYILVTHDLDFGAILAATGERSPSVIQLRTQDIAPDRTFPLLLSIIYDYLEFLSTGVLISVDQERQRLRMLPIQDLRR